jgi:transcriptional regulator with XRE-family HTH domain
MKKTSGDLVSRALDKLRQRLEDQRFSIRKLESKLDVPNAFLWKRLNGKIPIELGVLLEMLEELGEDPQEFFQAVLSETRPARGGEPSSEEARLARRIREGGGDE